MYIWAYFHLYSEAYLEQSSLCHCFAFALYSFGVELNSERWNPLAKYKVDIQIKWKNREHSANRVGVLCYNKSESEN